MKNKNFLIIVLAITTLFVSSFFASISAGATFVQEEKSTIDQISPSSADMYPYLGILRVYVVEPESRWMMHDNSPYHYAFLDYALVQELTLDYNQEFTKSIVWNPANTDFSDVEEDNIMVIAAVYNQNVFQEYAYPPFSNQFNAQYVEATAGAKPGQTSTNIVSENFTHSVLVEEGTATWCPYCPAMAHALNSIYDGGNYPFYFIAFVTDENPASVERMQDMNLAAYPSSFFDGGDKVVVGGYDSERTYTSKIESVGRRDVHDLDLELTVDWTNSDTLDIDVIVRNNEEIAVNEAPDTPSISGNVTGPFGESHQYEIKAKDNEKNSVFFMVDWGDGETTDWFGPYPSNSEAVLDHIWDERGEYAVRVKAKDIYDQESDWGDLEGSMPKTKIFDHPLLNFLENYPVLYQLVMKFL